MIKVFDNKPDKLACFVNRELVRFDKSVEKTNCWVRSSQFRLKITIYRMKEKKIKL